MKPQAASSLHLYDHNQKKVGLCVQLVSQLVNSNIIYVLTKGRKLSTHRSGDGQEAVVADEDDVEDGRRTQQVVHDQPQLTQSSAQHPPACECVRDVDWDAERTCRYR